MARTFSRKFPATLAVLALALIVHGLGAGVG